jgi:glucose-1-phosphate adenylyltransferase
LAGGQGERLQPLTKNQAKPAVPFAGIHRLIDFTLSNCYNSGFRRINVLTQYMYESLHSYIGWLSRKNSFVDAGDQSLRCLSPVSGKRYRGTADAVFHNLPFLENSDAEFVLILSGDHIYKMDYRNLLRFHAERGADVTIAGVECPKNVASQFGVLETDSTGYAIGFEEKPNRPKTILAKPKNALVSMGVYVFNKRTLIDALSDDAVQSTSHDFGKDILPALVQNARTAVYNFSEAGERMGSYWRDIGTLDAYYHSSMELLLSSFLDPYARADWPMLNVDENLGNRSSEVRYAYRIVDSIISRGVSVGRDSQVIHSVLSPGAKIESSSTVQNAVLLHNVQVGSEVRIRRAILAENVYVADGVDIGYDIDKDRQYGLVTDRGVVVIPANTYVGPRFDAAHAKWRTEIVEERPDRLRSSPSSQRTIH